MQMTKYGAKKVVVDEIVFDSKMESQYYLYLKEKKGNGEIKDFTLQPEFILQPKFEKQGKKYRPITYKADFKVIHNDDRVEIVDVKGFTTNDFKIKAKLFNYQYEESLTLITHTKKTGWIELEELTKIRRQNKKSKNK